MTLTADAATIKVTVPSKLPIHVDEYGVVTVATNAAITNESTAGRIQVTDVSISSNGSGWTIQDYDTYTAENMGAKEFALNLNGDKTTGEDAVEYIQSYWPAIAPNGGVLGLPYEAKAPAQTSAVSETELAQVTFFIEEIDVETEEIADVTEESVPNGQLNVTIEGLTEGQTAKVSLWVENELTEFTQTDISANTGWPLTFSNVPYGEYNLSVEVFDSSDQLLISVPRAVELASDSVDITVSIPQLIVDNPIVTNS